MEPLHKDQHPNRGQAVQVTTGEYEGLDFLIEDWYDRVSGFGWQEGVRKRNADCIMYAVRLRRLPETPRDDEILVGMIGGHRLMMHVSHLGIPTS